MKRVKLLVAGMTIAAGSIATSGNFAGAQSYPPPAYPPSDSTTTTVAATSTTATTTPGTSPSTTTSATTTPGTATTAAPTGGTNISIDQATYIVGSNVTLTVRGCQASESVNIEFPITGYTDAKVCAATARVITQAATGSTTFSFRAPSTPGTFPVNVRFSSSGQTLTAQVVVVAATNTTIGVTSTTVTATLPTTGSGNALPASRLATLLVLGGGALLLGSRVRGRSSTS